MLRLILYLAIAIFDQISADKEQVMHEEPGQSEVAMVELTAIRGTGESGQDSFHMLFREP